MADEHRAILAVYGHPDDEVLGTGATLARYAGEGVRVALACATRGEAGEISDPSLATPETLPSVREEELRCSCQALGIGELFFLGYRDSGMAGTEDNRRPDAFTNADMDEAAGKVVRLIREIRPQVMVTFNEDGAYGHPDHIKAHQVATEAFTRAGDPAQFPEQLAGGLQPFSPRHLYYTAIARSFFQSMVAQLRDMGVDVSMFGQIDIERMGTDDEAITAAIDAGEYVEAKLRAFACHRTQMSPDSPFARLPEAVSAGFMAREHFVEYGVTPSGRVKTDLFAD